MGWNGHLTDCHPMDLRFFNFGIRGSFFTSVVAFLGLPYCCAVVLVSMVFWHWLFGNRWISMVLDSWLEWPASPESNDFLRPIMLMFIVIIIDSYFDSSVVVFLSFWGCTVCWCWLRCIYIYIYCREACLILWSSLVLPWLSWIKHFEQIGAFFKTWPYHGQCLSLLRLKHFFSLETKRTFLLSWIRDQISWSRICKWSFFLAEFRLSIQKLPSREINIFLKNGILKMIFRTSPGGIC